MPALNADHRVLRYDLRGFGLSEKIRTPITMDDEVADLAALLAALKIDGKVTLIGGAVGGAVALRFAHDYPERVDAVAVTSPAVYMNTNPERALQADDIEKRPPLPADDSAFDGTYPPALRTDASKFARFKSIVGSTDPGSHAATQRMLDYTAFKDVLPKIECPTLIVATSLFPRPVASFEELAETLPNGKFLVLETGHFAAFESPEMVIPVLQGFLAETAQAQPRQ